MQTDHTVIDLLDAVGITAEVGGTCPSGHRLFMGGEYIGPALGTPEMDALLLVAGFKWMLDYGQHEARFSVQEHPGHALARAIREAAK